MKRKMQWVTVGLLALGLWPSGPEAQDALWQTYFKSGTKAYLQGQYEEAERLLWAAFKEAEEFGGLDLRMAESQAGLGRLYHTLGRHAEAEPLYRRALETWVNVLGSTHPKVAVGLGTLGQVYYAQGRYHQAEPLYRRSLKILERVVGPAHPVVAAGLENYAALLRKTGREPEAARLEAHAGEIRSMQKNGAKGRGKMRKM